MTYPDDFDVKLTLGDDGFDVDRIRVSVPAGPVLDDDAAAVDCGTEPAPGRAVPVPEELEAPGTGTEDDFGTGTGEPPMFDAGGEFPTRLEKTMANVTDPASEWWRKSSKKPGGIAAFIRAEPQLLRDHAWHVLRGGGVSAGYKGAWRYVGFAYELTIGLGMDAAFSLMIKGCQAGIHSAKTGRKAFANPVIGLAIILTAIILFITYLILG